MFFFFFFFPQRPIIATRKHPLIRICTLIRGSIMLSMDCSFSLTLSLSLSLCLSLSQSLSFTLNKLVSPFSNLSLHACLELSFESHDSVTCVTSSGCCIELKKQFNGKYKRRFALCPRVAGNSLTDCYMRKTAFAFVQSIFSYETHQRRHDCVCC